MPSENLLYKENLRVGTNILVTGGAGFIGSNFIRRIDNLSLFRRIYVVDCLTYASDLRRLEGLSSNIELIQTSISKTSTYLKALSECDYAVNFAAESHVDKSILEGENFIHSNIVGSYNFFEACRNIPNLSTIHISTDEVYGSFPHGEADENCQINPSSIYSASKASSDLLALANFITHNQMICISRCSNNYGPFQNSEKFIPKSINNLLNGGTIPIYGSGENLREWIYVSDHSAAILSILRNFEAGKIFNIGSGDRFSNLEIAGKILSLLEFPQDRIEFIPDRKGHDFRYALNSSRIRNAVGWEREVSFDKGLRDTVNWYRNWYHENGETYK